MSQISFTASGVMIFASLVMYLRELFRGNIRPNPITWSLSLGVMIVNIITYYTVSNQNGWAIITPTIVAVGMFVVVTYSIATRQAAKIGWIDGLCFGLAILAGILWQTTKNVTIANLGMQVVLFVSFWPTILGVIKGTTKERALPWFLGSMVYVFQLAGVLFRDDWNWVQLVYPVINGIIGNGLVVVVALVKNRQTSSAR